MFLFSLIFFISIVQQSSVTIKGKIKDQVGHPIPYANVYIDQTSIGVSTDLDGNYELKNIPLGQKRLIVNQINYQKVTMILNLTEETLLIKDITLKEAINVSDQVVVEIERDDEFNRIYNRFKHEFLGYSDFAKECDIVNPEYLELKRNDYNGYDGKSLKPIHVKNFALGYDIFYEIDSLESLGNEFSIEGDVQFIEMHPKNDQQMQKWLRNRKIAFKFSLRYFLKSLFHKNSGSLNLFYEEMNDYPNNDNYITKKIMDEDIITELDNGFKRLDFGDKVMEVVQIKPIPQDYRRFFRKTILFNETRLVSFLRINGLLDFNKDGYFITQGGFKSYEIEGYFSFYRVAGLLPDDYDPDSNSIKRSD